MTSKELVQKLNLLPHPEGGFYRETYRSEQVLTLDNGVKRNANTSIYYLLEDNDKSAFHKIKSDELWFFHLGNTLEIVFIENDQLKTILLGSAIENGEVLQAKIPANTWFGSRVKDGKGFSLVSCTVAPGFDFADFELADRDDLLTQYPHLKSMIQCFT